MKQDELGTSSAITAGGTAPLTIPDMILTENSNGNQIILTEDGFPIVPE